jgi:hypothetical protein
MDAAQRCFRPQQGIKDLPSASDDFYVVGCRQTSSVSALMPIQIDRGREVRHVDPIGVPAAKASEAPCT